MELKHGGTRDESMIDFSISVNPFVPPFYDEIMRRSTRYARRYNYVEWLEPDFRKIFGDDTVIMAGATEALHIIGWFFLRDANVIVAWPNYTEYLRVADFCANKVIRVPIMRDLEVNYEDLRSAIGKELNSHWRVVVFFGNPNNPTGVYSDVSRLIETYPEYQDGRILFVIDEAFVDFVDDSERIPLDTKRFKNVILLRSFTKICGLPGVRVGYVKGAYAEVFERYRMPWAIGADGFAFLEVLLERYGEYLEFVKNSRGFLAGERARFRDWTLFKSSVNFVLLEVGDADHFLDFARGYRIHVRRTDDFGLKGFVRVGLRSSEENEILLCCLEDFRSRFGAR